MSIKRTCNRLAKELGEDPNVVYDVVMHQFHFIREVMNDPEDTHDILINKLFRFKLKKRFKKNKQLEYKSK